MTNARRGLIVGVAISLLWLVPQVVTRWKSGQSDWEFTLPAGVWLNALVGSPFAEELLYRQIVFRALSERLALWKAVCGSALWFTLLHAPAAIMATTTDLVQYLSVIFVYGVVFAFAYSLAKSLWASLIPHVANNVFYAMIVGE